MPVGGCGVDIGGPLCSPTEYPLPWCGNVDGGGREVKHQQKG